MRSATFATVRKTVSRTRKLVVVSAVLTLALAACAGGADEPAVPSATQADADADGFVRFPLDANGRPRADQLAAFAFADSVLEFGRVRAGELVERRFAFRNAGVAPLAIADAKSTCGCTVPRYPTEAVAPGDTASLLVAFDTRGKSGPQDKPVTLTANTYPTRTTVRLRGFVEPD